MSLKDSLRVMVVDDMSTSRGILTQCLDELGIKNYMVENNGQSAFQTLTTNPVHLVLSDYNMPGMDGLGLLKALREHRVTQRVIENSRKSRGAAVILNEVIQVLVTVLEILAYFASDKLVVLVTRVLI